ncbi:hypothetical protein [Ornithinibacillus sp. JPR2-1]|uniref:hypothetical protein n=1 Tax=Ornithinibacillus sp. JPR2-1 TaxID=2094019 RepID=UPI0031DA4B9E
MITYNDFMKHAAVVTKNASEQRPVLKGIKHYEDGRLAVTDSHRLYIANGVHSRTDGAVLNPTGKLVEGRYPEVDRLLPYNEPKQEIRMNVKDLYKIADIMYSIGKLVTKIPLIDLTEDVILFDSNEVQIAIKQDIKFEVPLLLNAKYLFDAVKLFQAADCETITLKIYSGVRPILLEGANLQVIILPVRRY